MLSLRSRYQETDLGQDNRNVTETVAAVKTRHQSAKEREEREKDDIASAESGATSTPSSKFPHTMQADDVSGGTEELMVRWMIVYWCCPQLTRRKEILWHRHEDDRRINWSFPSHSNKR